MQKGAVLLAVNDQVLLGLTHEQAVGQLRSESAEQLQVRFLLLLLTLPELDRLLAEEGPTRDQERAFTNFVPSWIFWLQLPKYRLTSLFSLFSPFALISRYWLELV